MLLTQLWRARTHYPGPNGKGDIRVTYSLPLQALPKSYLLTSTKGRMDSWAARCQLLAQDRTQLTDSQLRNTAVTTSLGMVK